MAATVLPLPPVAVPLPPVVLEPDSRRPATGVVTPVVVVPPGAPVTVSPTVGDAVVVIGTQPCGVFTPGGRGAGSQPSKNIPTKTNATAMTSRIVRLF